MIAQSDVVKFRRQRWQPQATQGHYLRLVMPGKGATKNRTAAHGKTKSNHAKKNADQLRAERTSAAGGGGGGGGGAVGDAADGEWEVRDTRSKAAVKKEKRLAAQGRTGAK